MKRIAAAKFKEQCLALLDRVDPEGIIVTKRGRPVARLLPYHTGTGDLIGALKDRVVITGEVLSTGVAWRAER
jgi:prevent-host-death family protein